MTMEAVVLLEERPTARDLWADLNRMRAVASAGADAFDVVATALKGDNQQAVRDAAAALSAVLGDARLPDLLHQLSSMKPAKNDPCDQAHDPELWDVRRALLEAVGAVERYLGDPVKRLGAVEQASSALRAVAWRALKVTAASEAEQALAGRSVGSAVPLVDLFPQLKGEPKQQQELAHRIATRSGRLVVDEERAIVYVKPSGKLAPVATCLAPLVWVALGALVLMLPTWLDLDLGAFWAEEAPLGAYALVLAGVLAHILVTAKKEQDTKSGAPLPLGSPLDWLQTRWASIGLTFVWAVVTVIGLGVTLYADLGSAALSREAALAFLFAGYSVDSVAGLFLARFDVLAKKGTMTLEEKIAAAAQ